MVFDDNAIDLFSNQTISFLENFIQKCFLLLLSHLCEHGHPCIRRTKTVSYSPLNSKARLSQVVNSINSLAIEFDLPIVISMHPRTREKINQSGAKFSDKVIEHEPFGFIDYMKLQKESFCVLSDSGTISEESSILRFPAVTLRDSMERPEALDVGAMIMTGLEHGEIKNAVKIATSERNLYCIPEAYDVFNHSQSVVKFIQSTLGRAHEWLGIRRS
jgi:UDP-N-acetylglucosamine 2-epimerase (non-hydrolysing)